MSKSIALKNISKYALYEASVQDAADDAKILYKLYTRIRGYKPHSFREDFCGTFKIASEWVKIHRDNSALGLDIDPVPISYGKEFHWPELTKDQQNRLSIRVQNVLKPTKPSADLIAACNFSYWIFKKREQMIHYFSQVRKSLKSDGLFFLDIVGGYEMMELHKDRHRYKLGKTPFTYIWQLERFNPITHDGFFSISYEIKGGKKMKRAFTYDWRVWTIPELRECMAEAGFKRSWVYWEKDDRNGHGTGEFYASEKEENCPVWIAFIVGSKN